MKTSAASNVNEENIREMQRGGMKVKRPTREQRKGAGKERAGKSEVSSSLGVRMQ